MTKRIFLFLALMALVQSPMAAQDETDFPWEDAANRCTSVLINKFMNKTKGTFYATPNDQEHNSGNIYWQQAHAIDVVVWSYERIKDTNDRTARTYLAYFDRWYNNHANNYHIDANDPTGFLNPFTDDMCWICLSLLHITEATGDEKFADTARKIYDNYIITRAWTDSKGTGLPWNWYDNADGHFRNACTNTPGCLIAAKLYQRYGEETYLDDALAFYDYIVNNLLQSDGRVEEPPLTYTQGTFGEACRQLYKIKGERKYITNAYKVLNYALTSGRCTYNGLLRDEGSSMDQSLFKAVLIPYVVNTILDDECLRTYKERFTTLLKQNAEALWSNLDQTGTTDAMYCNYYWGEPFTSDKGTPSMGAQASGASLMEGVARIYMAETGAAIEEVPVAVPADDAIYTIDGVKMEDKGNLPHGIYIRNGQKVVL